jgi:hypothetical protein
MSEQLTFFFRKTETDELNLQVHFIRLIQTRFEFSQQHLVWTQNALRSEIWRMVPKMEDADRQQRPHLFGNLIKLRNLISSP